MNPGSLPTCFPFTAKALGSETGGRDLIETSSACCPTRICSPICPTCATKEQRSRGGNSRDYRRRLSEGNHYVPVQGGICNLGKKKT